MHTHWYKLIGKLPVPCANMEEAAIVLGGDRQVALTETSLYRVSTVFLGLDHNHGRKGPPILFETMVCERGSLEDPQEDRNVGIIARYSSWDEAERGHDKIVVDLRSQEAKARKAISSRQAKSDTR